MKADGLGYELGQVRTNFADLANHRKGRQAKPKDLAATRISS